MYFYGKNCLWQIFSLFFFYTVAIDSMTLYCFKFFQITLFSILTDCGVCDGIQTVPKVRMSQFASVWDMMSQGDFLAYFQPIRVHL